MAEENPGFKVGEIVRLNSGGPDMTIDEVTIYENGVICVVCKWFTNGELKAQSFSVKSIMPSMERL